MFDDLEAFAFKLFGHGSLLMTLSTFTNITLLRHSSPSSLNFILELKMMVAQLVKHLPTMQETRVQSLGQEDPLEKEMTAHSSIQKPDGLQIRGSQRVGHG